MVTGGGTGGHTTPVVAVIQEIRKIAEGNSWTPEFCYLGSRLGAEHKIIQDIGVNFIGIETGKLRRSRNIIGLLSLKNAIDALRVPISYAQAVRVVRRFRPDVVFSTGGYVSVPGVLASAAMKIPVVAHEQTVQVGLANKINFRAARVIALSVEETIAELPKAQAKRVIVTGNPVRDMIFGGVAAKAARRFGFPESEDSMPTAYITGGAQGSRLINRVVEGCLANLLGTCRIIHQCGVQPEGSEQDYDRLTNIRQTLPNELLNRYAVTKFVGSEIGDVFALASLVIGRSGAGTLTELCALGKPGLLIPLVPTGGDEQTRNARRLVDAGGAQVIEQSKFNSTNLIIAVLELLTNPAHLELMGQRAKLLAMPDAARNLAEAVIAAGRQDVD